MGRTVVAILLVTLLVVGGGSAMVENAFVEEAPDGRSVQCTSHRPQLQEPWETIVSTAEDTLQSVCDQVG